MIIMGRCPLWMYHRYRFIYKSTRPAGKGRARSVYQNSSSNYNSVISHSFSPLYDMIQSDEGNFATQSIKRRSLL